MTQNEHVYAIFCRPEAAGDVISSENEKTTEEYVVLNFEAASFSSFRENQSSHLRNAQTTVGPLEPHFRDQEAKMSSRLHTINEALK